MAEVFPKSLFAAPNNRCSKLIVTALFACLYAGTARGAVRISCTLLFPMATPNTLAFAGTGTGPATPEEAYGEQVVGGGDDNVAYTPQSVLWSGPSGVPVILTPTGLGMTTSAASSTNGTQQVGYGAGSGTGGNDHALLWRGTAASAVDLNPTNLGFTSSLALGTNGSQQVGEGAGSSTAGNNHALLWTGSAGSAIDLNPASLGISTSSALGTDGINQVGTGYGSAGFLYSHALLWRGTAASAVDLQPTALSGFTSSTAVSTIGGQQVGSAFSNAIGTHAMLWNGTANSAVDLNPTDLTGIYWSTATGTNGTLQVGFGYGNGTNSQDNAPLWDGTASSAIDLQSFLPTSMSWSSSWAFGIDTSGNVFGAAYSLTGGCEYAIEWSVASIPEPSALCVMMFACLGPLGRHRLGQAGFCPGRVNPIADPESAGCLQKQIQTD